MFELILGKCQWDPDPAFKIKIFSDPDPAKNGPDPQPCV